MKISRNSVFNLLETGVRGMHIKRHINILTYMLIVSTTTIVSCVQMQDEKESKTTPEFTSINSTEKDMVIKNGNITTTISTDIDKLGQFLDLETYKPTKIKFKYTFIDNSGQNQRHSIPGPSDYSLQALLYFDSLTFEKFLDFDRNTNYSSPNFKKDEFKFDWLDNENLEELNKSKENYHENTNFFFGTTNLNAWYLDKKILVYKRTN